MMTQNFKKITVSRIGKRLNWQWFYKSSKQNDGFCILPYLEAIKCLKHFTLLSDCFFSSTRNGLRLYSKGLKNFDLLVDNDILNKENKKQHVANLRPYFERTNISIEFTQPYECSWLQNVSGFLAYEPTPRFLSVYTGWGETISRYIVSEILCPSNVFFQKGLNQGILKTLNTILKHNQVIGLQAHLVGRFKKSKTGRKQSMIFKYGKFNATSNWVVISEGTTCFTTRFGTCSLKVAVCYPKTPWETSPKTK